MTNIILVPVDGSPNAETAVSVAATMAQTSGAQLIALHVMRADASDRPQSREYELLEHAPVSERSMLQSKADEILQDVKIRVKDEKSVEVQTVLRQGDPATNILEVANDRGADLIVMGSRGLGTLKGLLLGSVSHKVSQLCECNCLIVK